ncbi:LysR family transcriptional regulator [Rhodococcus sp. RS1C4]|uniref:LysR family transcriptional regulator n=1 Tax=unclassified Rhodococcus (in: high G+C Gram-positive bacteria) TaxID=192944 RepID=UPI0003690788|nr:MULTISPECIES: LysR family transcriptional regulator [unclassified Rhodococcus (in: high G+C Gram-positive bacteria)]OZC48474.1 LysR family transcriptional regulator [Rhodococcus sp. RS1C4]OZF47305.1 LysR family transcriptional regulator [Rhodococcus sp. 14-2470-1a]
MPTLRALECFVAVVDAGSVTAGAVKLNLSQPALSHQLASLETEIGTPLLERLPRGVRTTPTGRALLDDARAALSAADRIVRIGRASAEGREGRLRLGCAESMTVPVLAPTLRKWTRKYPHIGLDLTEFASADAMADALSYGDIDLAVGPASTQFTGVTHVIGTEDIVAVIPEGLDLADEPAISWTDLAGRPIVHYHPSNGLRGWFDSVATTHGVELDAVTHSRNATTAAQLAHAGLGIALVPTTALPARFAGIVTPMRPPLQRAVVAMVGTRTDALTRRFVDDLLARGMGARRS